MPSPERWDTSEEESAPTDAGTIATALYAIAGLCVAAPVAVFAFAAVTGGMKGYAMFWGAIGLLPGAAMAVPLLGAGGLCFSASRNSSLRTALQVAGLCFAGAGAVALYLFVSSGTLGAVFGLLRHR